MFCTLSSSTVIPSSFPFRIRLGTRIKGLTYTNLQWKGDHRTDRLGLSSRICNRQAQAAQKLDRHGIHCIADTLLYLVILCCVILWNYPVRITFDARRSRSSTLVDFWPTSTRVCIYFPSTSVETSTYSHWSWVASVEASTNCHGSKLSSMEVKFNSLPRKIYFRGNFDLLPRKLRPVSMKEKFASIDMGANVFLW